MTDKKRNLAIRESLSKIIGYCRSVQGPGINDISSITTHVLISNYKNALNITRMRESGIKNIFYIGKLDKESVLKKYEKRKIRHTQLNVEESETLDLLPHLHQCYKIIHNCVEKEERILIHCDKGVNLSPSIVSYYFLIRYYLTNFDPEADNDELLDYRTSFLPGIIRFIKETRACIEPGPNVLKTILVAEQFMKDNLRRQLPKKVRFAIDSDEDEPQKTKDKSDKDNKNNKDNKDKDKKDKDNKDNKKKDNKDNKDKDKKAIKKKDENGPKKDKIKSKKNKKKEEDSDTLEDIDKIILSDSDIEQEKTIKEKVVKKKVVEKPEEENDGSDEKSEEDDNVPDEKDNSDDDVPNEESSKLEEANENNSILDNLEEFSNSDSEIDELDEL
jgi:hypothetical protein